MKYQRKELTNNLIQYKFIGEENKYKRLCLYNDILFNNLVNITGKNQKTIIIINEMKTGGLIISNPKYIEKVFENFKKINAKYGNEYIAGRKILNINKKIVKMSFNLKNNDKKEDK